MASFVSVASILVWVDISWRIDSGWEDVVWDVMHGIDVDRGAKGGAEYRRSFIEEEC